MVPDNYDSYSSEAWAVLVCTHVAPSYALVWPRTERGYGFPLVLFLHYLFPNLLSIQIKSQDLPLTFQETEAVLTMSSRGSRISKTSIQVCFCLSQ